MEMYTPTNLLDKKIIFFESKDTSVLLNVMEH